MIGLEGPVHSSAEDLSLAVTAENRVVTVAYDPNLSEVVAQQLCKALTTRGLQSLGPHWWWAFRQMPSETRPQLPRVNVVSQGRADKASKYELTTRVFTTAKARTKVVEAAREMLGTRAVDYLVNLKRELHKLGRHEHVVHVLRESEQGHLVDWAFMYVDSCEDGDTIRVHNPLDWGSSTLTLLVQDCNGTTIAQQSYASNTNTCAPA